MNCTIFARLELIEIRQLTQHWTRDGCKLISFVESLSEDLASTNNHLSHVHQPNIIIDRLWLSV